MGKLFGGVILAFMCFFAGYTLSNYHWQRYFIDEMLEILNAQTVEYSIWYMEKYAAGDREGAHELIKDRAFEDPGIMSAKIGSFEAFLEALSDNPSLLAEPSGRINIEGSAERYITRIRARQEALKRTLEEGANNVVQ
jgi:hypothetical protein